MHADLEFSVGSLFNLLLIGNLVKMSVELGLAVVGTVDIVLKYVIHMIAEPKLITTSL